MYCISGLVVITSSYMGGSIVCWISENQTKEHNWHHQKDVIKPNPKWLKYVTRSPILKTRVKAAFAFRLRKIEFPSSELSQKALKYGLFLYIVAPFSFSFAWENGSCFITMLHILINRRIWLRCSDISDFKVWIPWSWFLFWSSITVIFSFCLSDTVLIWVKQSEKLLCSAFKLFFKYYTFVLPPDVAVICLDSRINRVNWSAMQNSSDIEKANTSEPLLLEEFFIFVDKIWCL